MSNSKTSYDDHVRAQYAAAAARRKLDELTPSLRGDVVDFAASGLKPTARNVRSWLKRARGTWGAVDTLVDQIVSLHPVALAAKAN